MILDRPSILKWGRPFPAKEKKLKPVQAGKVPKSCPARWSRTPCINRMWCTSSGCEDIFPYTLTPDQVNIGEDHEESEISVSRVHTPYRMIGITGPHNLRCSLSADVESSTGSRHVHEICIKTHAESMCFCALIMVGGSPRYGGIEMIAINHGGVRVYVHEWPR
jgi:hypothetical protein